MTSVIFTGLENRQKPFGFGDFANYILLCNCRAKELNCNKIGAVFPILAGEFKNESNREVQKIDNINIEFIRIKDLEKRRTEFDIEDVVYYPKKQIISIYNYLNYYYLTYKKYEVFDNIKDNIGKNYILFHYRFNNNNKNRNASIQELNILLNYCKELLGDKCEYWKTGEVCTLDNKFDNVIDISYDNINLINNLVRNSSFIIASSSGVFPYAQLYNNAPFFVFSCGYPDPYHHFNDCSKIPLDYGERSLQFMGEKFYGKFIKGELPKLEEVKNMFIKEGLC